MGKHDELLLWHALHDLEARYWHDVDFNCGRNAHEFYRPDGLMVVGHNPGLEEVCEVLIASGDIDAREQRKEHYPTSGLAVIDFAVDVWDAVHSHSGRLDRFIVPRALEAPTD